MGSGPPRSSTTATPLRSTRSWAPWTVTGWRGRWRSGGVRVSAIWGGTPAVSRVGPALFRDFLPAALADARLRPAPAAEVVGHELGAIPDALLRLRPGVRGRKLVVVLGEAG